MAAHKDMTQDQSTTRKYHEKEEFVTGHSGTSAHEIFLLCLVIPIGLHLYYKLRSSLCVCDGAKNDGKNNAIIVKGVMIEFVSLIIPMLLMQTHSLPYMVGPAVLLMGMLVLASIIPLLQQSNTKKQTKHSTNTAEDQNRRTQRPPFLTIHRSCVYILTTIAILAVDFPIFPRRFCKTEVGGYGWMDLGAASFIIIAGWASALSSPPGRIRVISTDATTSLAVKAIKKCTPLLLLGLIRLATNKGLEYQEHVSEYGVHWNFFITLCCVEGFMVIWKGIKRQLGHTDTKVPMDGILALLMVIPYQIYLTSGGQDFIENGDRRCNESNDALAPLWLVSMFPSLCNIFVANREGFLGVIGYLSLRLLSEEQARVCIIPPSDTKTKEHSALRSQPLFTSSVLLWVVHVFLTVGLHIPNSRRSTNISFILWALAHNTSLLYLIKCTVSRAPTTENGDDNHVPQILEAVNRFGLAVFLSSNILTGLVNLTVDTLHSSDGKAMFVLSLYLALVCGSALLLDNTFKKKKKVE